MIAALRANVRHAMLTMLLPFIFAAGPAGLSWQAGPDMPRGSGGHAAVVFDRSLYIVGGTNWRGGQKFWLDDILRYDTAAGEWATVGRLPLSIAYAASASDGERFFVCGGSDGAGSLRSCVELSPSGAGLRCRAIAPLPEARVYAGAVICEDVLYVIGGAADFANLTTVTDTVYALDLADLRQGWRAVARLPSARSLYGTASAAGKLFVFGGCRLDANGDPLNLADCWAYDPAADTWSRLPDLPEAARGIDALTIDDDLVLLFGGYAATAAEARRNGPAYGFRDNVLAFRPSEVRIQPFANMPYAAIGVAPALSGRAIYLTGGEHRMRARKSTLSIGSLR